eukprot:m.15784 g.15784  ORF g.15784 m.15784 type:complete len:211 (-) comp5484_c0_seq1:96-728(-)
MASGEKDEDMNYFETETQFLGFSPVTFVDYVINAVNDACYNSSEDIVKRIIAANPSVDEGLLRQDVDKVLNHIQDAVDKYFDLFELYCLRNIFKVPKFMHMDSDVPKESLEELQDEEKDVDAKLEDIRVKLSQERSKKYELQLQLIDLDLDMKKEEAEKKWRAKIKTKGGVSDWTQIAKGLTTEVAKFAKLGQELKSATEKLPATKKRKR